MARWRLMTKTVLVELDVHRTPPHAAGAVGIIDDAFIQRTAAGFLAGADDQRAAVGDGGVLENDGVFIERRRGRIEHGELRVDFMPGKIEHLGHAKNSATSRRRLVSV